MATLVLFEFYFEVGGLTERLLPTIHCGVMCNMNKIRALCLKLITHLLERRVHCVLPTIRHFNNIKLLHILLFHRRCVGSQALLMVAYGTHLHILVAAFEVMFCSACC